MLSDVFGVDAALRDGARPFHREGFSCLVVRDGDGLAQATLFVRHITAPDGQRTVCVALFGADDLRLTEGERAALDADIRDWLVGDGVLDASGNVIGGDWL